MWFIIRCVFCVGLVFSKVPASGVTLDASAIASAAVSASPALNEGLAAVFSACESHLAACLDTARHLQGAATSAESSEVGVDGDTLTATDRAEPWRGGQKRPSRAAGKHASS